MAGTAAGAMAGSDRPVFVLGCPRSGTTLLQVMLHSHPRIALPPENRFLLDAYRERRRFGDLRQAENRAALARWIVARPKFADLGLDPDAVVAEIVAGPPTVGSALGIVLRSYARRFGKARWGDKRPGYFIDVPALLRLFPDAQFVHVVRDGRDCVASLKRMSWFKQDSVGAMAMWASAIDYGRRNRRALPADAWHDVVYERLVADPEEELRRLCAFLGEEYDPAMAQPHGSAGEAVPEYKTWHARLHQQVDAAKVGAWRGGLEPWEAALMEHVSRRRLRAYGYPLTQGLARPPVALVARYRKEETLKRLSHRRRSLLARTADLRLRQPVAAQLTAGQLALASPR